MSDQPPPKPKISVRQWIGLGLIAGNLVVVGAIINLWYHRGGIFAPLDCYAEGKFSVAHWQRRSDGLCHEEDSPIFHERIERLKKGLPV
jgi:hypothetical protein